MAIDFLERVKKAQNKKFNFYMTIINRQAQFLGRAFIQNDLHAAREGCRGGTALFAAKSNTACT